MIRLFYINNYGNGEFIVNKLEESGISISKKGIHAGLMGCDPPYYMEVSATKEEINKVLFNVKTPDTWGFYR